MGSAFSGQEWTTQSPQFPTSEVSLNTPPPGGCAYLLNSSKGLVACECVEGESCSGFRLVEKACRCLSSRRTTSTCSSVGEKDSCKEKVRARG